MLEIVADVMHCDKHEITDVEMLKKGMTNRTFCFTYNGNKLLLRIPGEGTDKLIDRRREAEVYHVIAGRGLCDDVVYIDPERGYKITRYLHGVRNADPTSADDVRRCIEKLRGFHEMKLTVGHEFDIYGQIDYYEQLRCGTPSVYADYEETKRRVLSLRSYIGSHRGQLCLTHIDAVPDNFLFTTDSNGNEELQLTDWEYAGMQDPHVDIAMFCIYSGYSRESIDSFIDLYFDGACPDDTRIKIYCYISACGLLWSNWCEYKHMFGVTFGEYAQIQYDYAVDYSRIAEEMIGIV